ncbi:MAG TPA: hypothetical protein VH741_05505, partial [Candidatus Limnocylindrales bacterium]
MTRTSTASSSTDARAADERAAAEREAAERATRRQFFRLFGRQTVDGAGSVLAGVAALRQTSQAALDELLAVAPQVDTTVVAEPAPDALRSPYRIEANRLLILDQRQLPEMVATITCRDANAVAAAIRSGALGAGPVLGQVAAYTIALAAESAVGRPSYAMAAALRGAADTLRAARPINRPLAGAIERVLRAAEAAGADAEPASAARAEAELVAMEAALD